MECSSAVTLLFDRKSVTKTDRCAGALSWRTNQRLVLHIFQSDRIPKAIKDSNEHIFIHSSNSCKSYQWIPGTSWTFCLSIHQNSFWTDPYWRATPACLLSENTYPGVIKPESIKGQLEVKILVDLWYGIVDVCLVVAIAVVAPFVKETVQEFTADLPQANLSDDVGIFIRSKSLGWWSISVFSAIWNRMGL